MLLNLINEIRQKLDTRLKPPYVSNEYTEEDTENLLKGIEIAIKNGLKKTRELSATHIIEIFDAMNPKVRSKMKETFRRSPVAFEIDHPNEHTKAGWVEFLNLAEEFKRTNGPKFEIYDTKNQTMEYFKQYSDMRQFYNCSSNEKLVDILFDKLKDKTYKMRFIPTFDCMNPFCDREPQNKDEFILQKRLRDREFLTVNDTQPIFNKLISEFNKIEFPSIKDISILIKKMILLHPFHDGNGRTFTLGVLNQLLIKHHASYCLNLDPRIAIMTLDEIEQNIKQNLIKFPDNIKLTLLDQNIELLKQFRDEKLALNSKNQFGNEYSESIRKFYAKAVEICKANKPVKEMHHELKQLAHNQFYHRHSTRRLIADALIVIGFICAGLGFFVGLGRVALGHSFFFSKAMTSREQDFNQNWLNKVAG